MMSLHYPLDEYLKEPRALFARAWRVSPRRCALLTCNLVVRWRGLPSSTEYRGVAVGLVVEVEASITNLAGALPSESPQEARDEQPNDEQGGHVHDAQQQVFRDWR